MDAFQAAGMWWLPANPENLQAGTLIFKPHGEATLDLLGTWDLTKSSLRFSADPSELHPRQLLELEAASESAVAAAKNKTANHSEQDPAAEPSIFTFPAAHPVVHGVIDGRLVTLLGIQEAWQSGMSVPGFPRSRFEVAVVLVGAHTGELASATYEHAVIDFDVLPDWVHVALETEESETGNAGSSDEPVHGAVRNMSCELPGGAQLGLTYKRDNTYSLHQRIHTRRPVFTLQPGTPSTLLQLLEETIAPLQNLLTTAVGAPAALNDLRLTSADHTWNGVSQPIDVGIAHHRPEPSVRTPHPDSVLLPLSEVEFAALVPSWFRTHSERSVATQFAYALRYGEAPYGEMKIIIAAAACEALHASQNPDARTDFSLRPAAVQAVLDEFPSDEHALLKTRLTHFNKPSLRQRLRALVNNAGNLVTDFIPHRSKWVGLVVKARNDVAHGERDRATEPQLNALAVACGHLVELSLLLEAGASRATLAERLRRSPHHRTVVEWQKRYLMIRPPQAASTP